MNVTWTTQFNVPQDRKDGRNCYIYSNITVTRMEIQECLKLDHV